MLMSVPLKKFLPNTTVYEMAAFSPEDAAPLLAFYRDFAHEHYQSEITFAQRPDTYCMEVLKNYGGTLKTDIPREGHGEAMLRIVSLREFFESVKWELNRRLAMRADVPLNTRIMFRTDIGEVILQGGSDGVEITEKAGGSIPVSKPGRTCWYVWSWGIGIRSAS